MSQRNREKVCVMCKYVFVYVCFYVSVRKVELELFIDVWSLLPTSKGEPRVSVRERQRETERKCKYLKEKKAKE